MNQQAFPAIQISKDIFRASPQPLDLRARQAFCHAFGQGPAQIGAVHLCPRDAHSFHRRGKAASYRLDLGQFAH